MDISYFMAGELLPGSKVKLCVWYGCPLSSLRAYFLTKKKKKNTLHPSLYFQSIAVIDVIAALSTQHIG